MANRAAIYARQSVTQQGSASLAIQVEACRETAKRFGIEVVRELVEPASTSGYKNRGRDRPRFLELLDLIRTGVVDSVVIYQTDRLSRGGGVGGTPLLEAIEAAGHDHNRFILRPDGWLSEFELGIRAAIDREEAAKTSARMLDVRAREAREGKPRPAPMPALRVRVLEGHQGDDDRCRRSRDSSRVRRPGPRRRIALRGGQGP